MKKNFSPAYLGLIVVLLLTMVSCSKDNDDLENATHVAVVTPIPMGITRIDDVRIFISEAPFQSWDKFKPLSSVDLPAGRTAIDPIKINISDYVGKTIYFTALRKHLLSDGYYSVMSTTGTENRLVVSAENTEPEVSFVITNPAAGSYTPDVATARLTVKKGSNIVSGKMVYFYPNGTGAWGDEMKGIMETRFMIDGDKTFNKVGATKADGTVDFSVKINEDGATENSDTNEYAVFVVEGGKIKDITLKFNALSISSTLQY